MKLYIFHPSPPFHRKCLTFTPKTSVSLRPPMEIFAPVFSRSCLMAAPPLPVHRCPRCDRLASQQESLGDLLEGSGNRPVYPLSTLLAKRHMEPNHIYAHQSFQLQKPRACFACIKMHFLLTIKTLTGPVSGVRIADTGRGQVLQPKIPL